MAESPAHLRPWTHSVVVSREVHRRQPLIYSWTQGADDPFISFGWLTVWQEMVEGTPLVVAAGWGSQY